MIKIRVSCNSRRISGLVKAFHIGNCVTTIGSLVRTQLAFGLLDYKDVTRMWEKDLKLTESTTSWNISRQVPVLSFTGVSPISFFSSFFKSFCKISKSDYYLPHVCPSGWSQLGTKRKDFYEIWYLRIFENLSRKFSSH